MSWVLICLYLASRLVYAIDSHQDHQSHELVQDILSSGHHSDRNWHVSVSRDWNVLGPFPIHAREQHFLSPSFPLNLSELLELDQTWPSSYADGGHVGWTTARSECDEKLQVHGPHILKVSYPHIRWDSLRSTEGWASLQHHSILHTTITVYPPLIAEAHPPSELRLLVHLLQGSFLTILPRSSNGMRSGSPEWHTGNIYGMERAPYATVRLPSPPSTSSPTTYDLFISGDYEIRLFGDPLFNDDKDGTPVLTVSLSVKAETMRDTSGVARELSHDVVCDFVNGWAFGDIVGIGLRSQSGWWTVSDVIVPEALNFTLSLAHKTRIGPTQTRIVSLQLIQHDTFTQDTIWCRLYLVNDIDEAMAIDINLPVTQHLAWTSTDYPSNGIKASYLSSGGVPTNFVVKPPRHENKAAPRAPILALHGAGVDIISMPFWIQSLPRQERSWVIAPTGRTAWGLDWHGPSSQDAWSTVDALYHILHSRPEWCAYEIAEHTRVLLLGHSNGGQGTWYNAARYPDRVIAAIPAAAYIKSQAYIPLTQSRSAHYIDPALRSILETALTPDDNDLFLTNLADTPIYAIHGGDDENVPVWHTRELISTLKTWNPKANVTYQEDAGQPHWYERIFIGDAVQEFILSTLENESASVQSWQQKSFTLTVSNPIESGSLHGWSIHSLIIPGRLARLTVNVQERNKITVRSTNVRAFSIQHDDMLPLSHLLVDGREVFLHSAEVAGSLTFVRSKEGSWYLNSPPSAREISGRLSNILTSSGSPITVIADTQDARMLSAVLRIAHNLDVYHKLDVDILNETDAVDMLHTGHISPGNIIVLGNNDSAFLKAILKQQKTSFTIQEGHLHLNRVPLRDPSDAVLFLHPHPTSMNALMAVVYTQEEGSLERALRLLPLRTGVPVPDWIVLGKEIDVLGAAGLKGAGVWGPGWRWNEAMSVF